MSDDVVQQRWVFGMTVQLFEFWSQSTSVATGFEHKKAWTFIFIWWWASSFVIRRNRSFSHSTSAGVWWTLVQTKSSPSLTTAPSIKELASLLKSGAGQSWWFHTRVALLKVFVFKGGPSPFDGVKIFSCSFSLRELLSCRAKTKWNRLELQIPRMVPILVVFYSSSHFRPRSFT